MLGLDLHDMELDDLIRDGQPSTLEVEVFEARVRWERGGGCELCLSFCSVLNADPEALRDDHIVHAWCLAEENDRQGDLEDWRRSNPGYGGRG